jgi:nucleoid-associated protein YgaU
VAAAAVVAALSFAFRAPLKQAVFASRSITAKETGPLARGAGEGSSSGLPEVLQSPTAAAGSSTNASVSVLGSSAKGDAAPTGAPAQRLQFDVVRVEPSGESVVAGRGAPGETITLTDGDMPLARAVADANGEVVFLPKLAAGEHVLTLRSIEVEAGRTSSSPGVAVVVQGKVDEAPTATAESSRLLVASAPPAGPGVSRRSAGVSKGATLALPPLASPTSRRAPEVAITGVEAEQGGSFVAMGVAPPGSETRVYLNGAFIAKVIADLSGAWALKIEKGMQPGSYTVRADGVEAVSGKVLQRAEVPFIFSAPAPAASPAAPPPAAMEGQPLPRPPSSSAAMAKEEPAVVAAIVKELQTATVLRGDSLWRISRKMLGRGTRYKKIYEANESQIRDPALIFPGQIFVMPNDPS